MSAKKAVVNVHARAGNAELLQLNTPTSPHLNWRCQQAGFVANPRERLFDCLIGTQ